MKLQLVFYVAMWLGEEKIGAIKFGVEVGMKHRVAPTGIAMSANIASITITSVKLKLVGVEIPGVNKLGMKTTNTFIQNVSDDCRTGYWHEAFLRALGDETTTVNGEM